MRYKTYEFDRTGRITIYPSLRRPSGNGPGRFVMFIRKLFAQKSAAGKDRS